MPNSTPIPQFDAHPLPYYREMMPRLFIQVTRIMPKMLDVMYMATDAQPTANEFVFKLVAKEVPPASPPQAPAATPAAQSQFSFAGGSSTPVAPVATRPASMDVRVQRMTKDQFTSQFATWIVFDPENPPETWIHNAIERLSWIGDNRAQDSSNISYGGPKVVAGVRDAVGYEPFVRWCMDDLGYLPQEVIVRYMSDPGRQGLRIYYGASHNGVHYLLLRSDADLVMARLKFGAVVSN